MARTPIIRLMQSHTLPNPYEIKESDIGRLLTEVSGDFGEVIKADVGKRVYLRDGILQMENAEQWLKRKSKEAKR